MNKLNESKILERLTDAALENNVALTYTHKLFYIKLLKLSISEGEESKNGLEIKLSTKQLSETLNISQRMVTQSIKRLVACGAIQRRAGEIPFPSCYSYITTLVPKFYKD